jgi:hypothetical protein
MPADFCAISVRAHAIGFMNDPRRQPQYAPLNLLQDIERRRRVQVERSR